MTKQVVLGLAFTLLLGVLGSSPSVAQVQPITSSGLNTQVSAPVVLPGGETQHNITGGTRPGGGVNLFHSFGEFGVPTNNIANFLNDSALSTTNILSRVTGGNPSNILGTIQTEGFGNANLFLMNPAGIVFGPNASLNVSGSTHFTTADYLKLADGVQFTALPSAQDAVLSMAPVAAFGFLESNPASLSVEGSTLSVEEGQTLSLVGGDIMIGSGLKAPGGKIAIASVASPGEMLADTFASVPNINGQSFTTMGIISLSEGATLDVSGDAAGTVIIRGGQLRMTNATISADTGDSDGASVAVDIQVSGNVTLTDTQGRSAITARTTGFGNAGDVEISSENLTATSNSFGPVFSLIDTHTSGMGNGGRVTINATDMIAVQGHLLSNLFFIDSGIIGFGAGNGGDIRIDSGNLQLEYANINSGDFIARLTFDFTSGNGGNVTILTDGLDVSGSNIATDGFFFGKAGDLDITAHDIRLENGSSLSLLEFGGGGALSITTENMVVDQSQIELETVDGRGIGVVWPGVTIDARSVEFMNGGTIRSQTFGDGNAGDVIVRATDQVVLRDGSSGTDPSRPSGFFTNAQGFEGFAGNITVETKKLEIAGGARIDTATQSSGKGGDVTIIATDSVVLDGQRTLPVFEIEQFGLGSSLPSGIFSRTVDVAFCPGLCGDAGNISISTGSVQVTDGAAINSGTTSNGQGGTITVNASDNISIAGTLDDATPGGVFSQTTGTDHGSGAGGEISLTSGQNFTLSDGATVSASSEGPGNAGGIHVTAANTILLDGASIAAEAAQASGGNIKLTSQDLIQLNDSLISSSVQGNETTAGGDVTLDPDFIILQNSHILAKAVEGRGGNITLIYNKAFLRDSFSTLDASSALGISGSVNIEGPTKFLSGAILPLEQQPVNVAALYGARCAASSGGQFSTFVDSKAESLSPTPGAFLASPLLQPAASTHVVADRSAGQRAPVILTASIAPLVLGHAEPTTACP